MVHATHLDQLNAGQNKDIAMFKTRNYHIGFIIEFYGNKVSTINPNDRENRIGGKGCLQILIEKFHKPRKGNSPTNPQRKPKFAKN